MASVVRKNTLKILSRLIILSNVSQLHHLQSLLLYESNESWADCWISTKYFNQLLAMWELFHIECKQIDLGCDKTLWLCGMFPLHRDRQICSGIIAKSAVGSRLERALSNLLPWHWHCVLLSSEQLFVGWTSTIVEIFLCFVNNVEDIIHKIQKGPSERKW